MLYGGSVTAISLSLASWEAEMDGVLVGKESLFPREIIKMMELAENHLEYLKAERPDLAKYMIPENRLKPVLIITSILSGSLAHICRTLSVGDVIRTINKKEVSTLAELRYVVEHNELCDLFAIETDCDILAVFSWEEIIADENRLSKACKYPISEMVKKVQKNKKMQIKK